MLPQEDEMLTWNCNDNVMERAMTVLWQSNETMAFTRKLYDTQWPSHPNPIASHGLPSQGNPMSVLPNSIYVL